MNAEFEPYRRLLEKGATLEEICAKAFADDKTVVWIVRLLRTLKPMPLEEAKRLIVQVESGMSLEEYQEKVILPALVEAFPDQRLGE